MPLEPDGNGLEGAALRGSAWLTLINVLGKGVNTLVTVVLALVLDERQMGLTTYVATLVTIGVVIQTVGMHDVIARTRRGRRRMAGTVQSVSMLVAVALSVAVVLARDPLAAVLGAPDAGPLLAVVAAILPCYVLSGAQIGLAHSTMQFRRRLVPDLVNAAVSAAVTVVLAVAGFGAYALAFGILAGAAVQVVVGVLVGLGVRFTWDRPCVVEALAWIRVVGPGAIIAVFLVSVDYLIVGVILGPEELGLYSLAFRTVWIPFATVAIAIAAASFPLYIRVAARDGDHSATVEKVSHLAIVLLGGTYFTIAWLAPHIVVLGEQWAPSAPVLVALAPYGFLLGITLLWFEAIRAANRPRLYLALQVAHLVVALVALLLLAPHGIVWAAVGHTAAMVVLGVLSFLAVRRSGVIVRLRSLVRPLAVLLAGCGAVAAVSLVVSSAALRLSGSPVVGLAADAVVAAAVFGAVVVLLDRRTMSSTLQTFRSGRTPARAADA